MLFLSLELHLNLLVFPCEHLFLFLFVLCFPKTQAGCKGRDVPAWQRHFCGVKCKCCFVSSSAAASGYYYSDNTQKESHPWSVMCVSVSFKDSRKLGHDGEGGNPRWIYCSLNHLCHQPMGQVTGTAQEPQSCCYDLNCVETA